MARPSALYRLFDKNDVLLYVGISYDPETRIKNHRDNKWWWPQVARHEVEWLEGSRRDAEIAEQRVMRRENPIYNVTGVPGRQYTDIPQGPTEPLIDPSITANLKAAADRYREFRDAERGLDAAIIAAADAGYRPKEIAALIGGVLNMQRIGKMTVRNRRIVINPDD